MILEFSEIPWNPGITATDPDLIKDFSSLVTIFFIFALEWRLSVMIGNCQACQDFAFIFKDLSVKAKSNAKFLVISGKPINEEIARGGPFVMNTKAEILQAVQDYHNGTFVK